MISECKRGRIHFRVAPAPRRRYRVSGCSPRIVATLTGLVAMALVPAASVAEPAYVPETLGKGKTYNLPADHYWYFPVMASLDRDPARPETDPLPWNDDLYHLFENRGYLGRYIRMYDMHYREPFGHAISNGPGYPSEIPAASTWLIQYTTTGCNPAYRNPATPAPPTFVQAKAAADAYCQSICGSSFSMTDFDMNQWKYICYNFAGKSYNIITWGGTVCEKIIDNGLIEPCNPLTAVVQVRNNLGGPLANCPECDQDGDGLITLRDLIQARNIAFGPNEQGLGMTFPIIRGTGKTIDQTMDLANYNVYENITPASYIEITAWSPTGPLDCTLPNGQNGKLDDLTKSDPADSALLNQNLANEWCQTLGAQKCASSSLGITFGHCRVNKDGTHSIRATGGYCYDCA